MNQGRSCQRHHRYHSAIFGEFRGFYGLKLCGVTNLSRQDQSKKRDLENMIRINTDTNTSREKHQQLAEC
jgi:hypothetical protein